MATADNLITTSVASGSPPDHNERTINQRSDYNLYVTKRVTKGNLWGFIQSRPYASVADIRRLFTVGIDDASMLSTSEGTYFIGLSQEAADLIGQLWHEGRIVFDTNPDVKAPVVQGIYPARAALGRPISADAAQRAGRSWSGRHPTQRGRIVSQAGSDSHRAEGATLLGARLDAGMPDGLKVAAAGRAALGNVQ